MEFLADKPLESMQNAEYLEERLFFAPTSMWLATMKSHETERERLLDASLPVFCELDSKVFI